MRIYTTIVVELLHRHHQAIPKLHMIHHCIFAIVKI